MSYKNSENLQFELQLNVGELRITLLPGCPWNIDSLFAVLHDHIHAHKLEHIPLGISVEKKGARHLIITGKLVHASDSLYKKGLISLEYQIEIVRLVTKDAIRDAFETTPAYRQAVLKSELHQSVESGVHMGTQESFV